MNNEITSLLHEKGADIIRFVDISGLAAEQTQGYPNAVLFAMALSPEYILAMREGRPTEREEFLDKEHAADELADWLAGFLRQKGCRAYSQSEDNLAKHGDYDAKTFTTRLPHKTIARLAGLGFIGKNNLLITDEYGCAFSMCTVLTDAPLLTESYPLVPPGCGDCAICKDVCPSQAIHGCEWSQSGGRESVVDVFKCTCPLKCMVNCPHTLRYALPADLT